MPTYRYSGVDRYYVDGVAVTDGDEREFDSPPDDDRWSAAVGESVSSKSAKAAPAAKENKE